MASGIPLGGERPGPSIWAHGLDDDDLMDDVSAAAFGLFGREEALRVLSDVLVQGGSAVAIGDPGVGKSSLLKVADQLAQRRGRRVLSVTPTQFDRGLPFAGLAELIGQVPEEAERSLPGPQRRALAVALHRAEPDGAEIDALAVPLAVQGLLKQLCESEPVTVIIDDLQWLDQATVGSLAFALRRISVEPQRLSILVGSRPDPDTGADLIRVLPEPRHELSSATLGGLGDRSALLTAARGDVDNALSELVKVVDQPGSECPFEATRSRLALGQVYRRAGYKGMASEVLNAAADAFEELDIPRWAERARDEAGRVGLHPTTSMLTETERRVAELVGSGHSNQETAAALFISVKTVEANLTRIYRKLSVRSRTELANRLNTLDSATDHDR